MPTPIHFMLAFASAIGLVFAGRFIVRNPEKLHRIFTFGQAPTRFGVGFFRVLGWFYIWFGAIAALMFVTGTLVSVFRSH